MITLVECAEPHRPLLHRWRQSPEVSRFMLDDRPIPWAAHDAWFSRLLEGGDRRGWVVEEDGRPVGACFLSGVTTEHRRASFGVYLGEPAARGHGVGLAAQYLLCERAFDGLGLHKLECEVLNGNDAAFATYRRLGFTEEGVLHDHLRRGDEWVDVHLMALFEDGWRQRRAELRGRLEERGLVK